MAILLFAENANGQFKKSVFEAATYGYDLAQLLGLPLVAVSVGHVAADELAKLGEYGISKVFTVSDPSLTAFANTAYAAAISAVAHHVNAKAVVMAQTYNGRAVAPRLVVKLDAAAYSGVFTLIDPADGFSAQRFAFSGKGVEAFKTSKDKLVITIKANGYKTESHPITTAVEAFDFSAGGNDLAAVATALIKAAEGVSLTEADIVVSAGRGLKGPENWVIIDNMAKMLGAATACSKPVSDMDWRPHHEHVGQTGIQIAPNLYFAIGISGAIQHLAGISSSKTIVVINKDADAPFFKIADYGIVGDLFEIVPQLHAALQATR